MKINLRMNSSKTIFYLMSVVVCLLVLGAAALVVSGNGLLAQKTKSLTDLKLETLVLEEQKLSVIRAQKDIQRYAELEQVAKNVVPQDKDQARAVRGIIQLAKDSGISIASITFPSSTLGQTGAGAAAAAPATPGAAAPTITQVKPVEGIPGVYQQEISLQSMADSANFPRLIDFLKRLEANRSTSQVSSLTITPNSNNRQLLTFSMVINVYVKP